MKPARRRRLLQALLLLALGGAFAALVISSLAGETGAYLSPSQLLDRPRAAGSAVTLGGWVRRGSFKSEQLHHRFVLADRGGEVAVRYTGLLPDLFAEGEVAIAVGRLAEDGSLTAVQVLARHDENYRPPGVEPPAAP